jgi:hypothetical protein
MVGGSGGPGSAGLFPPPEQATDTVESVTISIDEARLRADASERDMRCLLGSGGVSAPH